MSWNNHIRVHTKTWHYQSCTGFMIPLRITCSGNGLGLVGRASCSTTNVRISDFSLFHTVIKYLEIFGLKVQCVILSEIKWWSCRRHHQKCSSPSLGRSGCVSINVFYAHFVYGSRKSWRMFFFVGGVFGSFEMVLALLKIKQLSA